jgi:UDP-glucose 4-epimerase
VRALLDEGWTVRVLERPEWSPTAPSGIFDQTRIIEGDFGDKTVASQALANVDTLFHYASTTLPATAYGHSIQDVTGNLLGTLVLMEAAVAQGCRRVVFPSSGGTAYGIPAQSPILETHPTKPICSHGIVKVAIEHYLHLMSVERGLRYTILRYGNPYGPRQRTNGAQGAVAVFADRILKQQPIELWGDGSVVRDFIYIDDVVRATTMVALSDASINQVFNIGSGVGVSIMELIKCLEELTGLKAIVRFGAPRPFDVPVNVLAIGKARESLGWSPRVALREGLQKTLEAIRAGNCS